MADKKISELTAADALADADQVPVVQGGTTKRATLAQVAAHAALAAIAYQNTIIVDEAGDGDYTSLVAAMAGIISPSATNCWRVLVYGDLTESATIEVPSYTTIEGVGDASVKLADATDDHLIANADQVSGNADICIRNLHLDGNRVGQTNALAANASHSIYMVGVDGLTLENIHCRETLDQAFKLLDCTNIRAVNCGCNGAGTEGWSIENCQYGLFTNVYALNIDGLDADGETERPGGPAASGFEIEDGTQYITMTNVLCLNCLQNTSWHTQSHDAGSVGHITVNGLICVGFAEMGVTLAGLDGPVTISGMHLVGTGVGIRVISLYPINVSDFYIEATVTGIHNYYDGDGLKMSNGTVIAATPVSFDAGTAAQLNLARIETTNAAYAGMALPAGSKALGCSFVGGAYGIASIAASAFVLGCDFSGHATGGINAAGTDVNAVVANNYGD
uniref:Pectate lyase n=1 Tax=viral metagenome TaxID=1070528 RepID=A0A6M3J703_9ZZZZ